MNIQDAIYGTIKATATLTNEDSSAEIIVYFKPDEALFGEEYIVSDNSPMGNCVAGFIKQMYLQNRTDGNSILPFESETEWRLEWKTSELALRDLQVLEKYLR